MVSDSFLFLRRRKRSNVRNNRSLGVILFECLCGYPPFDSDDEDPMRVCKNIINWKKTLAFPKEIKDKISPQCISFVKSLICNADNRLGSENGATEIKKHPWLAGINFEKIREMDAPFVPEFSKEFDAIMAKLNKLDAGERKERIV